jgi:hypothetical protein
MKDRNFLERITRWMGIALCVAGVASFAVSGHGGETGDRPANTSNGGSLRQKWGIQIMGLRVTAAGRMIDFRYKVLDPEKAAPIAKRENKPYLIDLTTKSKLLVPTTPKIGALRQTAVKPQAGRVYGVMFANPAQVVKPGSTVTVVVGDCRLENLSVE